MQDTTPPSPSYAAAEAADQFLRASLERLEILLNEERGELSEGRFTRIAEFNMRKGQLLLEVNRALRSPQAAASKGLEIRLSALREKLAANRAVIGVHLEAAQEVVAIILRAIQDAESDGTYSRLPATSVALPR